MVDCFQMLACPNLDLVDKRCHFTFQYNKESGLQKLTLDNTWLNPFAKCRYKLSDL